MKIRKQVELNFRLLSYVRSLNRIEKKKKYEEKWIRKKKHTFFLGVLVHTSGCCSSVIMVVEGQGVLRMRMNGGQGTSGWVTWVDPDPDPQVKSTMLRRVRRKLHADHSTPPFLRSSPSSATLLRLGQHPADLDEASAQPLASLCNIFINYEITKEKW